jgi:flavin-dependent dehydrogenase
MNAFTDRYDVLVLGGGPAGCAAAISARLAGLSVALVEQAAFPRDRVGETLHPGVEPILRQLGVWERVEAAGFLRPEGIFVGLHGPPDFVPYGQDEGGGAWRGLQAWRATFDSILLERAREAGAVVLQPCRAVKPVVRGGRVEGVVTSMGTMYARVTVDACGSRHWLARRLGVRLEQHSVPLVVRYGYATGHCRSRDEAPLLASDGGQDAARGGWVWAARVRPNVYAWARLRRTGDAPVGAGEVPEEFASLKPIGTTRGEDATWRVAATMAGPGFFIAGDAAGVLDPGCSHGVLRALMSGMLASHAATQTLRSQAPRQIVAASYDDWLFKFFEHDMSALTVLYGSALRVSAAGSGDSRRLLTPSPL